MKTNSTMYATRPLTIHRLTGRTITSSEPIARIAASIEVTAAMTMKISNSAVPEVMVARNTDMMAFGTLPVYASAVANVASTAGIMTFLRSAMATIREARPTKNTICAAPTCDSLYRTTCGEYLGSVRVRTVES